MRLFDKHPIFLKLPKVEKLFYKSTLKAYMAKLGYLRGSECCLSELRQNALWPCNATRYINEIIYVDIYISCKCTNLPLRLSKTQQNIKEIH